MHDQDGYDYSEPFTVGGLSGKYQLKSPFPDSSQVAVLSVVFSDVGYITVSPESDVLTLSNAQILGGTQGATGVLRALAFNGTANFNITPDALFWQVGPDQMVWINTSIAASHTGYVSLMFRRPLGTRRMIDPFEVQPEYDDSYHRIREQAILAGESGRERKGSVER